MKNNRFSYLLIIFIIFSASCNKVKTGRPYVIGHRGMFLQAPENTLAAFSACLDRGIGIETDVRTTKDNELIVIHDTAYSRTTNGPGVSIRSLDLSEVKKLDAGSWFGPSFKDQRIPTLEETLELVSHAKKKVPVAVNIKDVDEKGEIRLVELLRKYDLLKQAFCFDQSRACSERLKARGVRIAQNVEKEKLQQMLDENFIDVFLIWFVPTKEEVEKLHKTGKSIILNLGGPRKNGDNPQAFHDFLTSGVDAVLIDHSLEFENYIESLKW